MFITSAQALDMLQHHAPRAWCKRLLQWEMFMGPVQAYFLEGAIIEKARAADFLAEALAQDGPDGLSLQRVEHIFGPEVANAMRGVGCSEKPELRECYGLPGIEVNRDEWTGEPRKIPIGAFVYADLVDFEGGRLVAEELTIRYLDEHLFEEAEEFNRLHDNAEFEVRLSGMCFELAAVEMLAPGAPCPLPMRFDEAPPHPPKPKGGPGRSRKWDWEGALAHIVSVANKPDGLPEGHGAQAAVERMISEWFIARTDGAPQESEIRKRAAEIMRAMREGQK